LLLRAVTPEFWHRTPRIIRSNFSLVDWKIVDPPEKLIAKLSSCSRKWYSENQDLFAKEAFSSSAHLSESK